MPYLTAEQVGTQVHLDWEVLPLTVSANGRYLIDQNGVPFLLAGEDCASLIAQGTNANIITYLDNRKAKGFNAVWANLLEHKFSTNAPNNIDNVAPFSGTAFQSSENDTYFQRADYLLAQAAARGIVVLLFPLYLGFGGGDEGWAVEVEAASTAQMQAWGTWVGNRYTGTPNIVWVVGADVDTDTLPAGTKAKVDAFAVALKAADPNHLFTFHSVRGQMAIDDWPSSSWLNLNDIYTTYLNTASGAVSAYAVSGPLPFFQIEGYYENENSMTTQGLRAQVYWTILGGGCGHLFGNSAIWNLGALGGDWAAALGAAGSLSMQRAYAFFKSINWWTLVPDSAHAFLTVGYGTIGTADFAGAAKDAGGTLAVLYMPDNRTMTVDVSQMAGTITCRWLDPTNGTYTADAASPLANSGTHDFSRASANAGGDADWALVLTA